ncbi:MAG: glycosyltransferase [Candidatus Gorgyraea atricola]|nr:glycosyltransferase [Candidatus Gorgyraea atricola]
MFILATYEIGGVSTVARNILGILEKNGIETVFLVEKLSDKRCLLSDRVKVIDLDIIPQKGFFAKIFNIMRHLRLMRKYITTEKPDVILSFTSLVNCYAVLSLLFIHGRKPKLIITEHSEQLFMLKWAYRMMVFLLYPRADYIVTVCKSISEQIKRLFPVNHEKVKVIYNPVDIAKIKQLSAKGSISGGLSKTLPCVGTVSRLSPEKGVHFLMQGFKTLLERVDARLIIVGDGVERSNLERMAEDLDVRKKVIFTGWVDNPFKYLLRMDIFVLPSLWEGFPNAALEAMACGVPVVASDSTGGIREAIEDNINGLLIKPGVPSAISGAVYDLLSNKEKRENLVQEAYGSIKQFDVDRIEKQYMDLIFN